MTDLFIVSKSVRKRILRLLKEQYGISDFDYVLLRSGKRRFWVCPKEIKDVQLKDLRIHSVGFYFGELEDDGFRLSFDSTQLFSGIIKKNVLEVDEEEAKKWLSGLDIKLTEEEAKRIDGHYVVIKHSSDMLGCGKVKNLRVLNHVPKDRRERSDSP